MENVTYNTYLLGCHLIVADGEINTKEIRVLDSYLNIDTADELYSERQKIFSDDENKKGIDAILLELKAKNLSKVQKEEIVKLLVEIAFSDSYMSVQEQSLIEEVSKSLNIDCKTIISDISQRDKEKIETERLKPHQKLIGKVQKIFFYNFGIAFLVLYNKEFGRITRF